MTETPSVISRTRVYTPKEFAQALESFGVHRSARWVADNCPRLIRTLVAFRPRHVIPETELARIVGMDRKAGK